MVTTGETCLLIFTAVVVASGAIMAALIGLVLPKSFLQNSDAEESPSSSSTMYVSKWIRERNAARTYKSIDNYKWLVSISLPLYEDAKHYVYACSGAIVAEDEVLTGKGCITNSKRFKSDDFYKAVVRSSSEYYSYGGEKYSIKNYSTIYADEDLYKQLIKLKVVPKFSKNMIIKMAKKFEKTDLEAVGWGGMRVSKHKF